MEENVDTDSRGSRGEAPVTLPGNGGDMTECREGWTEMLRESHAEELRDVVAAWGEGHGDFRAFVTQRLRPSINDVDFRLQLVRAINRESREVQTRYTSDVIVDWGKVYYDYIEPWAEQVDAMTTAQLCRLAEALLTVVCGRITEEDFFGDDWYGTDFSNELQEIADTVGGLVSFLVVRTDVGEIMLDTLEQIIRKLPNTRVLLEYLDSPFEEEEYDWLYELICKDTANLSTDYRTPLEFAKILHDTHFNGMSSILRETFLAYAADRYAQGRTVNPHKYTYFRQALETLGDYGYAALQAELVAILLERYRQRRSLVRELRAIRL